jgi:hypothetical protein
MMRITGNKLVLNDIEWYYLEKYLNKYFSLYDIHSPIFSKHWFGYTLEKKWETFSWIDEDQVSERIEEFTYLHFESQTRLQKFIEMYEKHTKECMTA